MRKFLNAIQDKVSTREHHDQVSIAVDDGPFPNDSDLFMYRKQRGVNLGTIHVSISPCIYIDLYFRLLVRSRTMDSGVTFPPGENTSAE